MPQSIYILLQCINIVSAVINFFIWYRRYKSVKNLVGSGGEWFAKANRVRFVYKRSIMVLILVAAGEGVSFYLLWWGGFFDILF